MVHYSWSMNAYLCPIPASSRGFRRNRIVWRATCSAKGYLTIDPSLGRAHTIFVPFSGHDSVHIVVCIQYDFLTSGYICETAIKPFGINIPFGIARYEYKIFRWYEIFSLKNFMTQVFVILLRIFLNLNIGRTENEMCKLHYRTNRTRSTQLIDLPPYIFFVIYYQRMT